MHKVAQLSLVEFTVTISVKIGKDFFNNLIDLKLTFIQEAMVMVKVGLRVEERLDVVVHTIPGDLPLVA